jgi:hypothetical protein
MRLKKPLVKRLNRFMEAEIDEEMKDAELIDYVEFLRKQIK